MWKAKHLLNLKLCTVYWIFKRTCKHIFVIARFILKQLTVFFQEQRNVRLSHFLSWRQSVCTQERVFLHWLFPASRALSWPKVIYKVWNEFIPLHRTTLLWAYSYTTLCIRDPSIMCLSLLHAHFWYSGYNFKAIKYRRYKMVFIFGVLQYLPNKLFGLKLPETRRTYKETMIYWVLKIALSQNNVKHRSDDKSCFCNLVCANVEHKPGTLWENAS